MNLTEFKAWFEGFTESIEGAPTEKQFERIKAKVKEIAPEPKLTYAPNKRDAIWDRGALGPLGPNVIGPYYSRAINPAPQDDFDPDAFKRPS